ncbi:uncharacterized protein BDZ99DRAFT_559790 [Mytilinidion resinicola]|uniref:DUF7907 domain-containing protein n=1 Tax=Mytilinidion resinicola TaxID=574789 RepID=A0A6A6YS76_9PEZI|nr:uncharacterized protein BDZ99DRAFT_559790 [Mytilinidion resinicola]KAF2811631.1 hypothetical protein BDZ99DRAFT_559790 [Mytilinidion resinicola]
MKLFLLSLVSLPLLALAHPNHLNELIHRPRAALTANSTSSIPIPSIPLSTGTSFPTSVPFSTGLFHTSIILSTTGTPSNTTLPTSTPPFANTTTSSYPTSPTSSTPTATPSGPLTFKLRTHLHPRSPTNPSPPSHLANLYLTSFHTGAGLADPVLAPSASAGADFFLNSTASEYGAGTVLQVANPAGYIWGFQFEWAAYSGWAGVTLNAAGGAASGWVVGITGEGTVGGRAEVVVGYEGSGTAAGGGAPGWLVCDWWHAVPQLFLRDPYRDPKFYPAPSSCAEVDLVMEFAEDGTIGG